jgi:hypothetical protein
MDVTIKEALDAAATVIELTGSGYAITPMISK